MRSHTFECKPGDSGDRDHTNWPIEEVLARYGWDGQSKRGSRGWINVRCPFHHDSKIGNAGYHTGMNSFNCQACGVAGNSVTLVMAVQRLGEEEAVEWLTSQIAAGTGKQAVAPGQQSSRLLRGSSSAYDSMFGRLRR